MEKSKKEDLYRKLHKLADMANDISFQLHGIADMYYEENRLYHIYKSLAIDADELSNSLFNNELPDTTTCKLHGEDIEMEVGDRIGFINIDGTVDDGYVTHINPASAPSDTVLFISRKKGGELFCKCHISKVMSLSLKRHFSSRGWNKIVENLFNQKKTVYLSLQNDSFGIKVTDDKSEVLFEVDGLYLKDFNMNLINELKIS